MKVKIKEAGVDTGFDRVYYRPVDRKDKRLFCYQGDQILICSSDGEPSHTIDLDFELVK